MGGFLFCAAMLWGRRHHIKWYRDCSSRCGKCWRNSLYVDKERKRRKSSHRLTEDEDSPPPPTPDQTARIAEDVEDSDSRSNSLMMPIPTIEQSLSMSMRGRRAYLPEIMDELEQHHRNQQRIKNRPKRAQSAQTTKYSRCNMDEESQITTGHSQSFGSFGKGSRINTFLNDEE